MDMTGERLIPLPRETVWQGLNDIEILRQAIPGCEEIAWTGDGRIEATVLAKIGPVKARFSGEVELSNVTPPEGYTISGAGKGGAAGFAKGGADVRLEEADGGTLLTYTAKAQVGGKLAQIGSRIVQAAAKKLSDDFFDAFAAAIQASGDGKGEGEPADVTEETTGLPSWLWVAGLGLIVLASLYYWAS